ncbi:GNAT family N-acetyltransferase [Actinophytocola xinjiangensis]|uniref:GNAT family N-acetyltransferase n=1 Tax=Actinophytocola xinjiangensis TaxID=485602 RepID=A0A7Z0WIZ8_9PSEU|nr:GNAT family N-acetyltransferase [Actinophytocola xinjiangensis]OLF08104.1 GNAT family N-acetyltransferase [Actinophytocola xinjiangensis]
MEITTWYLQQTAADQLRSATPASVTCIRSELVSPEFNRFLYTAVGGEWHWTDRLGWSWRQWQKWLDRPGVETWVAYLRGTPVGYTELDGATGDGVEIAYFGLLPSYVGKGIGGHLLTVALRRAWELTSERVWVHTCSLDGPAALKNYQSRGMTLYRTETTDEEVAATSPGPWPGAR